MLSGNTASAARNPLLDTNPITSPTSKFKNFSKEIDRDLSQDYIRRQLYAYGILHTQASSAVSSADVNSSGIKRAEVLREENSREKEAGLFSWKQLRTTTQIVYQEVEGRLVPSLRAPFSSNTSQKKRESERPSLPRWPKEVESIDIPMSKLLPTSLPRPIKIQPEETPPDTSIIPEEAERHVVYRYNNCSGKDKCFTKSRIGASHSPEEAPSRGFSFQENSLKFEARFESGNLRKANQVGDFAYELYLQHDVYTGKYAQWFFFQVKNMLPGVRYRFVIMNLIKPASLYGEGMRPLLYSEKGEAQTNTGWSPHGENVFYYKNHLKYKVSETSNKEKSHYSLSWSCQFPHAGDTCYFAHCYPYTYSHLQAYLEKLHSCPLRSKVCRQKLLCTTLAGNMVHLLTITNPSSSPAEMRAKRAIVISARVHPGETNSSFMMKGVVDFLTDPDSADAHLLRSIFVFKVVPMLNPDGVIVGNYRCSLSGCDLNRQYDKLSSMKEFFPVIFHLRQMMRKLCQEREVLVYCDLHGHSRKQNIFMYGCDDRKGVAAVRTEAGSLLGHVQARILPFMLSKNAPHLFSYKSSRFKVQKYKEGCGRISIWKEFSVMNSFTMEASFCGSTLGKLASCYFRPCDLEEMGHQLCDTFLDYFDPDPFKRERVLEDILDLLRQQVIEKLEKQGKPSPPSGRDPLEELDLLDELSLDSESDGGSDSSVSDGTPAQCRAQNKARRVKKKRKSKRSRNKNKERRKRVRGKVIAPATITVTTTGASTQPDSKPADPNPASQTRAPSHPKGKGGLSVVLKSTKEYSSYGSALNELALTSQQPPPTSGLKYKNRNGGIPVFSRERIAERNARKARESSTPLSGAHSSMPDMARSERASPESFTHEFLKNLPALPRETTRATGDRFPSNLRMEVFSPVCKPPEDGYQSDCESDASQFRNPTPLIISKVPTALYTGFASSYLSQYLSDHAKESSAPHKRREPHVASSTQNVGDVSQALWPTSKAIQPPNPKNMVYTSFVSEQRISDPPSASNSTYSLHKTKPSTAKAKPVPAPSSGSALHSRADKDTNKLEDIRKDIDFLFQSKLNTKATSQTKNLKSNSKPVHNSKREAPTAVPPIPPVPSVPSIPFVPTAPPGAEKSPMTPKLSPKRSRPLPALPSPQKPSLPSEQDDIKKLSIEIPKEHSHSFLPVSKQPPTHPLLPAPPSKEKSPLNSRLSIGSLLPFSPPPAVPSQEAGFSPALPKQAPVSLREQRISNAVHNIAEIPEHSNIQQTAAKPHRNRPRTESQTVSATLNSIDMSEHCAQIDRSKNEGDGRHSVALVTPFSTHSPIPSHISKLMQSGRKTSVGVSHATSVPTNTSGTEHSTPLINCSKSDESGEILKQKSKQVFISLSPGKGKGPVTIPYPSNSFKKTVVHTQPPPSPRRTPSPCKKSRLN